MGCCVFVTAYQCENGKCLVCKSSIQNYAVLSHFRGEKPHIFCDNDLTSSGTLCGLKFTRLKIKFLWRK